MRTLPAYPPLSYSLALVPAGFPLRSRQTIWNSRIAAGVPMVRRRRVISGNPVIYGWSITIPHLGVGLVLEMLSALIPSRSSYPALPVFRQQAHQGSVPPGPLVLRRAPLKNRTLALDRDRQFVNLYVAIEFGLYLPPLFT